MTGVQTCALPILLCPFSAYGKDDTTKNFVAAYEAAYGETPNQFAADAYDCVYAIYAAYEAGVINGDMTAAEMCDALKSYFTSSSFSGTTGEGQTWDANGFVSKDPKVYVITEGAYALAD